uniref:Phlebovirus glycoprotein G2 fusion domain-containing protein n=1 Tax=Strongyloides papillosus TaxID=174720 RepID=A0A0N5B649_STREA
MNKIYESIPDTIACSDSSILIILLIFTGFGIFFLYLILHFFCSLFIISSIDNNELGQIRIKQNRMEKAFSNSILKRDVIIEMENYKPNCWRENYTCTTYKPIVQTKKCIY